MRHVIGLVVVTACSGSGAVAPLVFGPPRQVEIFTNLSPQGIDLVTDGLGTGGDFACDAAGGVRDPAAGATYSRLADAGPVATIEAIAPPPVDAYVVVESVPLATGEGYVVRAADGCPARLRVDDIRPASFGSAVEVTYEHADCAQLTIHSTLTATGPNCSPGQMRVGGFDAVEIGYGEWPPMDAPLGRGDVVLRLPRGQHVTLKAHGTSVSWSGDCSGGGCSVTVDSDLVVNVAETVMWYCTSGP